MNSDLIKKLQSLITGNILTDEETLKTFSHDTSLFEVKPQAVVFPKTDEDVCKLVKFVSENKEKYPDLSLTGRSAGTDMSGGALNSSIIISFAKYFNRTPTISGSVATTEPGVFYRDFEKEALKHNLLFPSYPASKEICGMGGIVNNNAGGEKSLLYGKTEKYIKRIKVVLSDGNIYEIKPITESQLQDKIKQKNFEGEIYSGISRLIKENYDEIIQAKPAVSKNSAGYNLWDVWDREKGIFDLTKLWVGAQGTLGLLLKADIQLVPIQKHREMMIIFLHDLSHLGQIINDILPLGPESFEAYDDSTLKLALKYFPEFARSLGTKGFLQTGFQFIPEFFMVLFGGLPKMVLQIDFTSDDPEELNGKIAQLKEKLKPLHPKTRIAIDRQEDKYWAIRRESFNLLRQKIRDKHTAPFVDDFVVDPKYLPEFLPKVDALFKKYPTLIYTVAGHIGNGNFHIIPLMDITKQSERDIIPKLGEEIYDLVLSYHGSITGEHNDGLIRTPYLEKMYGKNIVKLFEKTKKFFDPLNIFNPGKKVHGSLNYAMSHIRQSW
ncbi:FAD-binding oxidoreductase [Candidatus Daviesbacteria bacterium]|nr:FAD-binding oxidoreductase [Candidatus Daviesbacteria bacterium]